jgi:hypothetical protein
MLGITNHIRLVISFAFCLPHGMPLDLAERVSQKSIRRCRDWKLHSQRQRTIEGAGREDRQSERESRIEQSCVAPNSGSILQSAVTLRRVAALCFTRDAYGSPKLPACSCVSITLPAPSQTRITALCERLKNLAKPIAFVIAFGSPYHRRPNGSASLIRSKPRRSLGGAEFQAIGDDPEKFKAFVNAKAAA